MIIKNENIESEKTGFLSIDKPYLRKTPYFEYDTDYCRKTAFEMILKSPHFDCSLPALNYYGKVTNNEQFIKNVFMTSAAFKNLGIKRDDIVFMFCLNTPETFYALYGLNNCGAISEWFNPTAISSKLLQKHLKENNIKFMITIDLMYPIVKEAIKDTNVEKVIVIPLANSFNLITALKYDMQVFGINSVLSNSYIRKNIEKIKNLLPSERDDVVKKEVRKLNQLQQLLLDLVNYANKEKILAKASFHVDKDKDERFITWDDFIKNYYRDCKNILYPYEDEKLSFIVHTGGTTGPVKRVGMCDYNINSSIYQSTFMNMHMDPKDTFCQLIPPIVAWSLEGMHAARYYNMMSHLICTYDRFEFPDIVLKTKANHYFTVPSFVNTLKDSEKLKNADLSFIQSINHGGEAYSSQDDLETDEFLHSHNALIQTNFGFGQNEEFGCYTINYTMPGDKKSLSCCGIPFPTNDYIIYDLENKKELKYGKNEDGTYNIGELLVSGPTCMLGYIGEDEKLNEETIHYINGKKYIDTGDQAYADEDGKLWYFTRNKRIIRTQDGKIFTNVIENIIESIPEVLECCVVASPHPSKVKEASCHIVLKEELKNKSKEELDEIIANIVAKIKFETSKMYTYYVPGTFEFSFTKLPRTKGMDKKDFMLLEKNNLEEYHNNGYKALKELRYRGM